MVGARSFEELKAIWLEKLKNELSPDLKYHGVWHTRYVLELSESLGRALALNDHDLILVLTAALFHDTGFTIDPEGHESSSCQIVRENLLSSAYTEKDIAKIEEMIMATRIPQDPPHALAEILCDADLAYIGTNEYFKISALLSEEWRRLGKGMDQKEWLDVQIRFLESHSFFTAPARKRFKATKAMNLQLLKDERSKL